MRRLYSVLALTLALSACGGDDEALLSDAVALRCPFPGDLPFRLKSRGFQNAGNRAMATSQPRAKDEGADVIGVPGGLHASIYLGDAEPPRAGAFALRGRKARSAADNGLVPSPLPGESVSLWRYEATAGTWQELGRTQTGEDGTFELAGSAQAGDGQPVYAMLEADGSCSELFGYDRPSGSRVIVTDIDGTLTTSDGELIKQITDPNYVPATKGAAALLLQRWAAKGYPIFYLTARPHLFRAETRTWLRDLGFPPGAVITTGSGGDAGVYKTVWMRRMVDNFGWTVVAAYGNADTDIIAYANANVPKNRTFIIGDLAGSGGTVAIAGDDYAQHISSFVEIQPQNP